MTTEQLNEVLRKAALYDEIKKKEAETIQRISRRLRAETKDIHKIAWFY